MQYLTKQQLTTAVEEKFLAFTAVATEIDTELFFLHPNPKWSIAENVQHLIISTNTSALAFTWPSFIVRWIGGKPNRDSKSYEALVDKYKMKLAEGGKATGRFVPKALEIKDDKRKIIENWNKAATKFIYAIKNKTTESKLDNYLVRHPLLGRITLRELCYFTIYHTEHHLEIIQKIIGTKNQPKTIKP